MHTTSTPPIPPAAAPAKWRHTRLPLMAVLLVFSFVLREAHFRGPYELVDEDIPLGVSRHLATGGSWDDNWRLAPAPMPEFFQYDQYNFSAYLYAAYGWQRAAGAALPRAVAQARDGLPVLRAFSVVLGALTVLWVFLAGERLGGPLTAVLGSAFFCVNPLLVQDAHYARPETFVTLLTLIVVWLCLPGGRFPRWRAGGAAFLVGLMIATKITLAVFMVAPLWLAVFAERPAGGGWTAAAWRARGRLWAIGGLGLLGAFAGMPYAFFHPRAYLHGVGVLAAQYGGFHPPHSLRDGGMVAGMMAAYFLTSAGPALFALFAAGSWRLVRRAGAAALVLVVFPVVFYFAYFATKRVFFERNLSHVIPLLLIGAAAGVAWLWEALRARRGAGGFMPWVAAGLAVVLALVPSARVTALLLTDSFNGANARREADYARELQARYPQVRLVPFSGMSAVDLRNLGIHFQVDPRPWILTIGDYGGDYTGHTVAQLREQYFCQDAGVYDGTFAHFPVSTLTVYSGHREIFLLVNGPRRAGN